MTDPNEQLPEETDVQSLRLIRDLGRIYQTTSQTDEHLARIHERLTSDHTLLHARGSAEQSRSAVTPRVLHRQQRSKAWQQRLQMVAAVLVAALVVGSLLLVLKFAQFSHAGSSASSLSAVGFTSLLGLHMLDATTGWAFEEHAVLRTVDGGQHWSNVTPANTTLQSASVADFRTAAQAWIATPQTNASIQVFFTSDGGQHWRSSVVPAAIPKAITFVDAQRGWLLAGWQQPGGAAEPVSVFATTDGGQHWINRANALFSDTTPPGHLPYGGEKSGISFLDATTGWVTGTVSLPEQAWLYVSHDGGSTWNQQSLALPVGMPSAQLSILSPTFFSASDGMLPVVFINPATETPIATVIYLTHDGGTSWQATTLLPATVTHVTFADALHGWATDGSTLYSTNDGAKDWQKHAPGGPFRHVSLLDFVSSDIGWAVSTATATSSTLLKTADGGQTWSVISAAS